MKGSELRKAFLDFFASKGHQVIKSSSLIPENDPTLLFTNAGMNQFKDCFLGAEKRSYVRAATSQKCLRISGKHNDLENVGVTARHHTFFEMLGNFSFGDYFKADAIKYAWEFVTQTLGLSKSRLWVTIFKDDDEAAKLWADLTDVKRDRILRFDEKDNFWAMGETGPCGPCSEIYYYLGDDESSQNEKAFRSCTDGSYMEIWNLVFMQYDRAVGGKLVPLPKPAIDTGMGLERISAVVQGKRANYDTDLLRGLISECEKLSGFKYDGSSYVEKDLKKDLAYARDVAMRVIADHSRAMSFLLADGVVPGSEGRGYVLRRIIRRAIRHGRVLGFEKPFLGKIISRVTDLMKDPYQELVERQDLIQKFVLAEETKFQETLGAGLSVLNAEVERLGNNKVLSGKVAFLLHDTYGFPLDLTQDALKAHGVAVDVEKFDEAMSAQKERSREDRKSQGISFSVQKIDSPETEFLGYASTSAESRVTQIIFEGNANKAEVGDNVSVILAATPFYAESGGQVGDTGTMRIDGAELQVIDTQKLKGKYFVHQCKVKHGAVSSKLVGTKAELSVNEIRRRRIMVNHSATHLVHAGLREVLGAHVKQAGSRVDDSTSRFDYSHFEPVTEAQLKNIEAFVNEQIQNNLEVITRVLPIEDAKKTGAIALFGEKYGDTVRVVQIGPRSIEFCGGTHVQRSGDIGISFTCSETGVSAGVRRIESWAGHGAFEQIVALRAERENIAQLLKTSSDGLGDKIERLLIRNRELEKELEKAKSKLATASSTDLAKNAITTPKGIRVVAEKIDHADADTLKNLVDSLRVSLGSGVVALGSTIGDSSILVAGVTQDLVATINAGNLIKEAAKMSGGRGGGRADFAQAGGVDPAKLASALSKVVELIP